MIKIVHCKKEPFDIYIGRPSKWGNPFIIGKDGTREDVVRKYYEWIKQKPELLADLDELKDKTLACWCSPQLCHGDVLKCLVENDTVFEKMLKDNWEIKGYNNATRHSKTTKPNRRTTS